MRRVVLSLLLAVGLVFGVFTADPAAAAPTITGFDPFAVCNARNPNSGGYVLSDYGGSTYHASPDPINGGPHIHWQSWCRFVPFVSPNYGPLCAVWDKHVEPAPVSGWMSDFGFYSC